MPTREEIINHQNRIRKSIANSLVQASDFLEKGKTAPVGTITNGRQKQPDGSWKPVKQAKQRLDTKAIDIQERLSRARKALKQAKGAAKEKIKTDIAIMEGKLQRMGNMKRETQYQSNKVSKALETLGIVLDSNNK